MVTTHCACPTRPGHLLAQKRSEDHPPLLGAWTLNGAFWLGLAAEAGSIEAGKRAGFSILDAPSYFHLVYHYGVNLVSSVYRDGREISSAR